ncbi:hypothetical protein SAMD00023353_0700290 [Rosellinia necatrix]|uniref:Caspase domain-containing protein n=1 Tax=Rosellinia necatrix TaxID=77044 RepID=A0A1S8A5S9_ROSNE|nr:hypothetical protein SAMD00023353_0700290 [Rosellinia necatrix]
MPPAITQRSGQRRAKNVAKNIGRFVKKTYSRFKRELSSYSLSTSLAEHVAANETNTRPRYRYNNYDTPPLEVDLKSETEALNESIHDAWPSRHHSRYRKVRALLVCWADVDTTNATVNADARVQLLGVRPSPTPDTSSYASNGAATSATGSSSAARNDTMNGPFIPAACQLASVLDRHYGAESQVLLIPSVESPQDMLVAKVNQFVSEYGSSDTLLLFWYGGHAEVVGGALSGGRNSTAGEVIWYGQRDELGVMARSITSCLGRARGDVVMLNDSPFAQHAYTSYMYGPRSFELLGSGSTTPSYAEVYPDREAAFTRTLALMLDSPALAARGVSTVELHHKLIDIAMPSRVQTDDSPAISPHASVAGSSDDPRGHSRQASSLIAAHAPRRLGGAPEYPVYCQMSQSAAAALGAGVTRTAVLSRLGHSLGRRPKHAFVPGDQPRLKIAVDLARPDLDARRWEEWIMRAPTDVSSVSVKLA